MFWDCRCSPEYLLDGNDPTRQWLVRIIRGKNESKILVLSSSLLAVLLLVLLIPANSTPAAFHNRTALASGADPQRYISVIYSDPADGEVLNCWCPLDWVSCRNSPEGNATWQGLQVGTIGATLAPEGTFIIQRIFLFFDTSSIPADAQIEDAAVFLYVGLWQQGSLLFHVVPSTASLPLSNEDFSAVTFQSGGSTRPPFPFIWMNIHLDEGAFSWINRGGMTNLALIHDLDLHNIEPQVPNDILVGLAEDPEYRPFLMVTYKAAPPVVHGDHQLFLPVVFER